MIYKVTTTKTYFVEADDKTEAEEMAFDDNAIVTDEVIVSVEKSSKRQMTLELYD